MIDGGTLLVVSDTQLLYYNPDTLQQTGSATVPANCFLFGMNSDGSRTVRVVTAGSFPTAVAVLPAP